MFQEMPTQLQKRIDAAVELAREVSAQTDPQEMVRRYREHARRARPVDASISLSRRDLHPPYYRITRWSRWQEEINPWKQKDRLPLLKGGLLADLIYGDQPRVISDLVIDPDEPAADYLQGMRSLLALPLYENGLSLNMVILSMEKPGAIDLESIPELIVTGNLFGRATYNLVMAERAREAFNALDAEFKTIARIQQCLLPASLPKANGIDLAAYYATAHRAGGDYYDVFPLDNHRSGILIADVSGHGAAAAVVMARMHAALHSGAANMDSPAEVLSFANDH
ncbi:MAG: SpoIIE family protein phosphatase, partial [Phycisphaerae bacterium]